MQAQDLAFQRDKYKHLSDEEWRWFLQQVEGRERTADKLPTFAAIDDWWYPVRLSCEQCSSELTARYKAQMVNGTWSNGTCLDLTGGYGVDTYFLSECFDHTDYVEQNAELCRIAEHNFNVRRNDVRCTKGRITVHNCTAEEFLSSPFRGSGVFHLIFLDPARRDSHGGKVFRLADCTPNVVELLPSLLAHLAPDGRIMLKLSPMLDITQALKELSFVHCTSSLCTLSWDVHVVAVKNEVKEVLLLSKCLNDPINDQMIKCLDLSHPEQAFVFTREEESNSISGLTGAADPTALAVLQAEPVYLYEPSAAILKAGAYKLVGARFGLHKLDVNTHLYVSDRFVPDFPGRVWEVKAKGERLKAKGEGLKANVLVRNYPLSAEQLKKKLHLRDGGEEYVIGCRIAGKPTLLWAERV